jgi:tRNA-specific 2-thiouridylase
VLKRGRDPDKDQSYFLFATTAEQLDFLRFPLGDLTKEATRAHAERLGLAVADKPDSQDICFVPTGSYASVVERLRPGAASPGDIVHLDGRVVGRHDGVIHFTIGQRRGLAISDSSAGGGQPLYVVALDPAANRVIVGPKAALARDLVRVKELNWLGDGPPDAAGESVAVKLRSAQPAVQARIVASPGGTADIVLDAPQEGIAPGQAAVFYRGERVLGGGWITAAARTGSMAAAGDGIAAAVAAE